MRCCRGLSTTPSQYYETGGFSTLQDPLKIGFGNPEIALRTDGIYCGL